MKGVLSSLHDKYVIVPADKASNNIVFVCKSYYFETDHHDITEILLKVALNTINQSIKSVVYIDNIISVIFTFSFELTERLYVNHITSNA
jgi:hypothetical protein